MFSLTEPDDYVSNDCGGRFDLGVGQPSRSVSVIFQTDNTALEGIEVLSLRLQLIEMSQEEVDQARNIFFLDEFTIEVNDTTGM